VGYEERTVKALSDREIADLRAGRGMGLALPAELNGYPGPLHVIELGERIGLTPDQRAKVTRLYDEMRSEAIALGEQVIEREAELDRLFATRTATPAGLSAVVESIGRAQAKLREAHLRHHLSTLEVLTLDQVELYNETRGYRPK
jgi:Spy/CpxP family protein refolding chaperone